MNFNISKEILFKNGERSFFLGIFFLSFIPILSLIFLLFALVSSLIINKINITKDRWNFFLLVATGLIIIATLNSVFFDPTLLPPLSKVTINNYRFIIFANTSRWILIFISYISFQNYLKTSIQRVIFAKSYLLGAIPLLISCFIQHWFKIYGPFKFLNGLVIWWNKPVVNIDQGIAGLFSNQNYTGLWLAILWPFCLYFVLNKKFNVKKLGIIILSFITTYYIFLSTSRGAISGLLLSLPFIMGIRISIILLIISSVILITLYFISFSIPLGILFNNSLIFPIQIKILINKILSMNLINIASNSRTIIWFNTYKLITSRPLFGYGAGIFPLIYSAQYSLIKAEHSHSLILQLAFDYGIPLTLVIAGFIICLLYKSWSKIFCESSNIQKEKNIIEKFWFASTIIAINSQIIDITYFEGRITILIWILLAGNKCIIEDTNQIRLKSTTN